MPHTLVLETFPLLVPIGPLLHHLLRHTYTFVYRMLPAPLPLSSFLPLVTMLEHSLLQVFISLVVRLFNLVYIGGFVINLEVSLVRLTQGWGMPRSPRFKLCTSCMKPVPLSHLHQSCLKYLGEVHVWEKWKICKSFHPRTKKDRDIRLKAILMDLALRPLLEPRLDLAPSTEASIRSVPLVPASSRHCLTSPVLKK